jgi:hypothetical protein
MPLVLLFRYPYPDGADPDGKLVIPDAL